MSVKVTEEILPILRESVMHDTAHKAARLFAQSYVPLSRPTRVLEVGSKDVNGGLRDIFPDNVSYVGVDIEPGPNVDHVMPNEITLPFQDKSFDIIIASSVFEHARFFWALFSEMRRLMRPGGAIYINAPSNGWYHRYPLDCYRFYPDASLALADWATMQSYHTIVIESGIVRRDLDVWEDFLSIFSDSPFIYRNFYITEKLDCYNVHRSGVDCVIDHQDESNDMFLIRKLEGERK